MHWICSLHLLASGLSFEQATDIGHKVWKNECACTVDGLTSWNDGEEFASLGIGHFIWYPQGQTGPYLETFPELLLYLKDQKVELPLWLSDSSGCPWKNREEFRRDHRSSQMIELRKLLQSTITLQTQFLQMRLEKALPLLIAACPEDKRLKIQSLYDKIQAHPSGTYLLLDYVNFKGYGIEASERYNGGGWGLFQVLDAMPEQCEDPIREFVQAAKNILEQRVKNAPSHRNERRFLKGWFHRLDTYTQRV